MSQPQQQQQQQAAREAVQLVGAEAGIFVKVSYAEKVLRAAQRQAASALLLQTYAPKASPPVFAPCRGQRWLFEDPRDIRVEKKVFAASAAPWLSKLAEELGGETLGPCMPLPKQKAVIC